MAKASRVKLVVFVKGGSNFHLLDKNSSLLLRGKLEDVTLDCDPVPLSSMEGGRLKIEAELIWKMSHRNFQRIKSSKALRLDCFNLKQGSSQGNAVGYIVINLKSLADSTQKSIGWRKLLGCSGSDSQSCPQLFMSVLLLDGYSLKKVQNQPQQVLPLDKQVEQLNGMLTELTLRNGISYIGLERFCKERFQLSCTLHSACHMDQLVLDKESFTMKPVHLQVKILGQVLRSSKFDTTRASTSFNQLFVFDILSQTAALKQFLLEHPSVDVAVVQSDKVFSEAKQSLEGIELGVPASVAVFLYGSDMNCELQPRVTFTLIISHLSDEEKNLRARVVTKQATLRSPDAPQLLDEDSEVEVISEFSKFEAEKETLGDMEELEVPEVVPQLELPLRLRASSQSNSTRSQKYHRRVTEDMNETARMTKVVEELEDWKLQQKFLFTSQLNAEKERLTSEWEVMLKKRQASLELDQLKALDMTKNFANKLEREIEKLKLRDDEMKMKFNDGIKNLEERLVEQTSDMQKQEEEHLSKINLLLSKNKQLQQSIDFLVAECTKLQKINKSNHSAEILELKDNLRVMELSLAKAEEDRAKMANMQKKAVQQARSAAKAAREQTKDNNNDNIYLDQERASLKREKESLEKLKAELMSVKQTPTHFESAAARVLQEQREALLKSGAYNEQSDVVRSFDQAIVKAIFDSAGGDKD